MQIIYRYDSVPTLGSVPFAIGNVIARQQMRKFRKGQRIEARQRVLKFLTRPLFSSASPANEEVGSLSYEAAV